MKQLILLFFCCIVTGQVLADYALPGAAERLVLLVDLQEIKLDKSGLGLTVNKVEHSFTVDQFWMQDRIYSDGICCGVADSSPKSAAYRVREVELALAKKTDSLLLVELVRVHNTTHFKVTYLKLFDPEAEYKRYYPKKTYYDTIKMPFETQPKDAKSFVEELQKVTKIAKERLGKPRKE